MTKPKRVASRSRLRHAPKLWVLVVVCACSGNVDDGAGKKSGGSGGGAAGKGAGPGAVPPGTNPGGLMIACDQGKAPGVTPLLKLSTAQYKNSVRDLLTASGLMQMPSNLDAALASVPDDTLGDSFRALDNRISLEHVQAYFNVGVTAGDAIANDPARLRSVAGDCAMTAPLSAKCAEAFVERFGLLAYRRPLTPDEVAELAALNDGARTPTAAIRAIVIVAMSSPRFVNHLEVDGTMLSGSSGADELLQLTAYEIASRLSYLLWQTMPDAKLFAAALDGSLATEAGFAAQLDRMFDDPRTRDTLWQFWNEWLRLEKFTGFETTRPGFQSLAAGLPIGDPGHDYYGDMVQEVRELTALFTFERAGTVAQLLSTDVSVTRSTDLAGLYGVVPWSGSGSYPTLPAGTRAGLFQRAALLVSNLETTNPFHRGALVRKNLLCDPLATPDPNSLPPGSLDPPPVTSDQTTRERFAAKVAGNATCAACHDQFSAIGFALESFDALGRHRTTEQVFNEQTGAKLAELPIDTSGVTRIMLDDSKPVMGAAELNQRLIDSKKVEACLATKYFDFALRRTAEAQTLDTCAIADLADALQDPQVGLAGAFKRIARHASFFLRKVGPQ